MATAKYTSPDCCFKIRKPVGLQPAGLIGTFYLGRVPKALFCHAFGLLAWVEFIKSTCTNLSEFGFSNQSRKKYHEGTCDTTVTSTGITLIKGRLTIDAPCIWVWIRHNLCRHVSCLPQTSPEAVSLPRTKLGALAPSSQSSPLSPPGQWPRIDGAFIDWWL